MTARSYSPSGNPIYGSVGSSYLIATEFSSIGLGFSSLEAEVDTLKAGTGFYPNAIPVTALDYSGTPTDGYVLVYRTAAGKRVWEDIASVVGSDHYTVKITSGSSPDYPGIVMGNISVKTADETLSTEDCTANRVISNYGAIDEVELTVFNGMTNGYVEFVVEESQYLKTIAPAGKTITFEGQSTAAAGFVRSNEPGAWWGLRCLSDGNIQMRIFSGEVLADE